MITYREDNDGNPIVVSMPLGVGEEIHLSFTLGGVAFEFKTSSGGFTFWLTSEQWDEFKQGVNAIVPTMGPEEP